MMCLAWVFSKDGCYSVKIAYMVGKDRNLDMFHQMWVKIWNLQLSPKVRDFLWRAYSDTVSIRSLLKHRHLIDDD